MQEPQIGIERHFNNLLKLTWQIYSFVKSQNQMPSEKRGLLQHFAIWAWKKNLAS
jgi:hypothetical protein